MLRRVKLGFRGPEVSEVCFGSLAISPLQGRLSEKEGREVLEYAVSQGIDWIDTAEIYNNYAQLKPVLARHPDLKIVSKTYAVSSAELFKSLEEARRQLDRDIIDIFMLHEQENHLTLKGHAEAWEALLKAKSQGKIKYIGISTHAVQGVRAAALQPGLDIIHPLVNYQGLGIIDGDLQAMLEAINFAASLGLGIYAMKVFGGGHLSKEPEKALKFIQSIPQIQAMALGMSSIQEVDFNVSFLAGKIISEKLRKAVLSRERKLYIADWCQGCGNCVEACPFKALKFKKSQVCLDPDKCILCGYCGRVCPHFCLKIV
jgi:aryl-alcohol dehydrogenase-like predicted oxidoreductase/ferredoxin